MRAILLVAVLLSTPGVCRGQPNLIYSANDYGYAREISVAMTADRVFLAETYMITVLDRATGEERTIRTELPAYQPVQNAIFADGALWLSLGYDAPGARRSISTFDGTTLREVARVHEPACSLSWSAGELLFVDQAGEHLHRMDPRGHVSVVASAPRGRHFVTDCRFPIASDATSAYLALAFRDPARPATLVRVPRGGGQIEQLDPDLQGRFVFGTSPTLVLANTHGSRGSIDLYDVPTRTRRSLVAEATPVAVALHGDTVLWLDGNFYSGDVWRLRRAHLSGGAAETLHTGDRRLGTALVTDGATAVVLVSGHPPGECQQVFRGCSRGGDWVTECPTPDYSMYAIPTP